MAERLPRVLVDVAEIAGDDGGGMAEAITWTNEKRRLSELTPWERNPRQITKDQARRLADSFQQFGQVETIAIGPGAEVYNGHQRLNVLLDKHGPDYEVEVRVASRPLTEKEREKLTIYLHEGAAGEWNMDALANWDMEDLAEWGFDLEGRGIGALPEFKEYTEDIENEVEYITCPECGHKWPK